MKIKVDNELFTEKLKKAVRFAPAKTLIPALDNIRLMVAGDTMEMLCGDGQSQIKLYCPVKSDMDGSFCLPAKLLLKTVELLRENEIVFNVKDKKVEIKSGKSKYNITVDTLSSDFPVMTIAETPSEVTIAQYYLRKAVASTEGFIDETSSLIGAEGININEVNSELIFTGLDRYIMCRLSIPPLAIGAWHHNIVMPHETANKVYGLLQEKGEVCMCHNDNKIIFFTDGNAPEKFEVISMAMNTKFPNTEMLFGKCPQDSIVINSLEFKDAVRRLKLYSEDGLSNMITVQSNDKSEIVLTAANTDFNRDGEEIISIKHNSIMHIKKTFSAGQILKILGNVDTNEFQLFYAESDKISCFIEPVVDSEVTAERFKFLITTHSA